MFLCWQELDLAELGTTPGRPECFDWAWLPMEGGAFDLRLSGAICDPAFEDMAFDAGGFAASDCLAEDLGCSDGWGASAKGAMLVASLRDLRSKFCG